MPTTWVIHRDELGRLDTAPLLADLGEDVAEDMRRIAPVDTGDMVSTVRVRSFGSKRTVRVLAGGIPGKVTRRLVDYVVYVERGTSKMAAQPFMRPALYRYRSPR